MALLRTLIVFFAIVSLSQAAELTPLEGKKIKGEIQSIDGNVLVFKSDGAKPEVSKHELTKIGTIDFNGKKKTAGPSTCEVEMIDGSHFHCSSFKVKGPNALFTLTGSNLAVETPLNSVLYMIRDISDPKLNQTFRGVLSKRGRLDLWIVLRGDKEKTLDAIPGTFGDGDAQGESVGFQIDAKNEKVSLQLSRIYGMILNPTTPIEAAQTVCKVIDAQDNVLFAKSLSLSKQGGENVGIEVQTVTGVRVKYPSLEMINKLDFSAGAVKYLSDLNPDKVEITSTDGPPEVYRRDRNLDNEQIKIGQKPYAKGLAIHSRTVLTYGLGGNYKKFEAIAGVDDSVEGESSVKLTIEADLKPIFTGVIKKGDKPKLLNFAILNVKQLRITVESDFLDLGNQVDLGMARVLK